MYLSTRETLIQKKRCALLGSRKKAHWKKTPRKKAHRKKAHRKKAHRKKSIRKRAHAEKNALGKERTWKKAHAEKSADTIILTDHTFDCCRIFLSHINVNMKMCVI